MIIVKRIEVPALKMFVQHNNTYRHSSRGNEWTASDLFIVGYEAIHIINDNYDIIMI